MIKSIMSFILRTWRVRRETEIVEKTAIDVSLDDSDSANTGSIQTQSFRLGES